MSIDQQEISGKTKFEVADMIRGQEATEVVIRVQPVLPYALACLLLLHPPRNRNAADFVKLQVFGNQGGI